MFRNDASVEDSLLTESSLLHRAKRSELAAWERIASLYSPLVYGWCRRCSLQPADAENVGQEVLLTVHRTLGQFEIRPERGTFRGWLKSIVRSKVVDYIRRRSQQELALGGSDAAWILQQVPNQDVWQEQEEQESHFLFRRAVELIHAEYSDRDWQVFRAVVMFGQSAQEVADSMQLTLNAVYLVKSRILQRVKSEFQGLLD